MNVDDGLDDIRWIRGLGVERLPAAAYILLLNREKDLFLPPERDRQLVPSVFHPPPEDKCFRIRRLAGARHVLPAML